MKTTPIILSTLNARYIHSALGLRYLYANLDELQQQASIFEFTIDARPIDIAEKLLKLNPRIIGFGVYIWNIEQTTQVVALIKKLSPQTIVVLGGPEVSYETENQSIVRFADYVITGNADLEFAVFCQSIFDGKKPANKIIQSNYPKLEDINFPYKYYSRKDIESRVLYVEASRGCPFKCEFCLSALDKTAWPFNLDSFLQEMEELYNRGARQFKFVDRTFNLKIDSTIRILQFFLDRLDDNLFLHFELIPDHLPDNLKSVIQQFPAGALQFEIGIQTFNPGVQKLISRKQDNEKTKNNISWLRKETETHLHTDLIAGLPGEDIESFATGFNLLYALNPHEIQVGILKRLKGTPIIQHTEPFNMVYNPNPPYNILSTRDIDFLSMQSISRFARYWDLVANSGRFPATIKLLMGDKPFQRFMQFSEWLFETTEQTHRISLPKLFNLIHDALINEFEIEEELTVSALQQDFDRSGLKGAPPFLKNKNHDKTKLELSLVKSSGKAGKRQKRHSP